MTSRFNGIASRSCPRLTYGRVRVLLTVYALFLAIPAPAQHLPFGGEDNLSEQLQTEWWRYESTIFTGGGLSLIGAQWRAATGIRLEMVTRPVTMRVAGTLRMGPLGSYTPDIDEWYDIVRLIDFVRLNTRTRALHVRVGLLDRMRLGIGHVVNFYNSSVAWDHRTVGAEFRYVSDIIDVAAFTGDLRLGGVSGGRIAVNPMYFARTLPARSMHVGFNYVTDRDAGSRLDAYSADIQLQLFTAAGVHFSPYISYAWYPKYGNGAAYGADVHATDFLDVISFTLRIGAFYSSREFIPGYIGALYPVHNTHARITRAGEPGLAGVSLPQSRGGHDMLTEFRMSVPPNFSLWYYYRRHFGGQALSEFHLRLFARSGDRLRIELGADKHGSPGFLGTLGGFGDQSALVFGVDYQVLGPAYVHILARYSFERLGNDSAPRYLVQRRFEPTASIRLHL